MRKRIYKTASGEVVVDTPVPQYQNEMFERCPHPWRFRDSNPNKEEFELEIKDASEIEALEEGKNEAGSAQFHYKDGKLAHDSDRSELLMHPDEIKAKHRKRLIRKVDLELEKQNPDPIAVVRLQREHAKVKTLTELEVFQKALENLDEDGHAKPRIREKLLERIEELE